MQLRRFWVPGCLEEVPSTRYPRALPQKDISFWNMTRGWRFARSSPHGPCSPALAFTPVFVPGVEEKPTLLRSSGSFATSCPGPSGKGHMATLGLQGRQVHIH